MRLNHAVASSLTLMLLLLGLTSMPLYGAEPLELKKDWQQPGANTERQGTTPQPPPGELQLKKNWRQPDMNAEGRQPQTGPSSLRLKENWRGSGDISESNTDKLKLKSDWKTPSTNYGNAPSTDAGQLKLKSDWKTPGPLQLKEDWKNSK